MALAMLAQLSSLINHQVDSHETLATYLSKADTLLSVAMKNDYFLDCPALVSHYYFWTVSDIVEQAKKFNDDSLSFLLKHFSREMPFAEKPSPPIASSPTAAAE